MKFAREYLCFAFFAVLLLLVSCHSESIEADTDEAFVYETEPQPEETLAESISATDTTSPEPITQAADESVTEAAPETEPPETSESITADLPDGLSSNITSPEAAEILCDISQVIAEYPSAAVYFMDSEGEYYFGIRENEEYHSASTIKAPYCQYLITSEEDLTAPILFSSSTRTSASGKLTAEAVGQSFTAEELIEYTIRWSDNQAYRLLYDTFGSEGYNAYVTEIGAGGLSLGENSEWAYINAKELSIAMAEICRTEAEDSKLIEHLKNTTFNAQISAGTAYETAHKYGYNGGSEGYHDTAVVFAPERAYILTILTHIEIEAEEDANALFRDMTSLCDKLHEILFLNK